MMLAISRARWGGYWIIRAKGLTWLKGANKLSTSAFTLPAWPSRPLTCTESSSHETFPRLSDRGVQRNRHGRHRALRQLLPLHGVGGVRLAALPRPGSED